METSNFPKGMANVRICSVCMAYSNLEEDSIYIEINWSNQYTRVYVVYTEDSTMHKGYAENRLEIHLVFPAPHPPLDLVILTSLLPPTILPLSLL
jgi:hypothetical protein